MCGRNDSVTIATLTMSGCREIRLVPGVHGTGNREFTGCTAFLHRLSPIRFPFTSEADREGVTPDILLDAVHGPWALIAMMLLVFADAFFVIVPGEIAVTALGALSIASGAPPLGAIIAAAAVAAACGDLLCYAVGRWVGIERWRWMRSARVRRALRWAQDRLRSGTAVALFTARFIPFARLAVNLVAGATRIPLPRYTGLVVVAATGWASYQAAVGALLAAILPGGPVVSILVSIVAAIGIGALIVLVVRRRDRARAPFRSPGDPG